MDIRDICSYHGRCVGAGAATAQLNARSRRQGGFSPTTMNEAAGEKLAKELGGVFVKCDVSREEDGCGRWKPRRSLAACRGLVVRRDRASSERSERMGRTRSTCSAERPSFVI